MNDRARASARVPAVSAAVRALYDGGRIFIRILPGVSMALALFGSLFVGQFSCALSGWRAPSGRISCRGAGLSTCSYGLDVRFWAHATSASVARL